VPLSEAAKRGILSGLEVRHPKLSRTGFFIDTNGSVLTTAQAVSDCGRIVLERSVEATVKFQDTALGYAVLTPASPLSPGAVAEFTTASPRLGAPVSLSGYSYEDKLSAPVVTRGAIEELRGLNGEAGLTRLTLAALPGDAGGPVLDAYGAVLGMLLPADPKAIRQLPDGVAFAASAAALSASLSAKGIIPATAVSRVEPTPNALAAKARGMTVLVSCWD
jgi:S1-C subfamily serine protease